MTPRQSPRLAKALRRGLLVNFTRQFEAGSVIGYVLEIGPRFFLVAVIDDGVRCNGFQCFRTSDLRDLRVPHRNAAFTEAVLKKRGERMPKRPKVTVASTEDLLLSANRAFPLVTIHREQVDPDVCWVGRVLKVGKGCVSFLQMNPDATWDQKPTEYKLREITRIDFGGDYEQALYLVGGPAPGSRTLTRR